MSFPIPSPAAVLAVLRGLRDRLDREGIDETDVRLQVTEAGWAVLSGAADYDQDHRGHWGADEVSRWNDDNDLRVRADSLVEQVVDSVEQGDA